MKCTKIFRTGMGAVLAIVLFLQWNSRAAEKDGGVVVFFGSSASQGPALFSHRSHGAGGAGYSCSKCHLDASTKTMPVTMHEINQGKACGACHDGRTKGPRSQRAASPVQECAACHMPSADIVINLNRMDAVAFSHVRHLGAGSEKNSAKPGGYSCMHCHPEPFERALKASYGMKAPHESGACAKCHNGQKRNDGLPSAFAATTRCLTCHKPPAASANNARP